MFKYLLLESPNAKGLCMEKRTLIILLAILSAAAILLAILPASSPDLQHAYRQAVKDAARNDSSRIVRTLTPITDANTQLIRDSDGDVLFVTWTSWGGYDSMQGKGMNLSVEVWVTVGRELQDFCEGLPKDGWVLRTEQEMGLPPGDNKTRFVEMFVNPRDIFRPCADPEINDTECGFSFPENTPAEYRAWFDNLSSASYGANGYPWTRLGYTYDWGSASHLGPSEYVVKPGSAVRIAGVYSNDAYCAKAS